MLTPLTTKLIKAYIEKPSTDGSRPSFTAIESIINNLKETNDTVEVMSIASRAGQKRESISTVLLFSVISMVLSIMTYNTGKRYLPFFLSEKKEIEMFSLSAGIIALNLFYRILKPYAEAWDEPPIEFSQRHARSQRVHTLASNRLILLIQEIQQRRLHESINNTIS